MQCGSKVTELRVLCCWYRRAPILGLQSCLSFEIIKLVYSFETVVPNINVKADSSGKRVHKNETVGHFQSSPFEKEVITKHYSDVFTGIGLFHGEVKVHNDQNDLS